MARQNTKTFLGQKEEKKVCLGLCCSLQNYNTSFSFGRFQCDKQLSGIPGVRCQKSKRNNCSGTSYVGLSDVFVGLHSVCSVHAVSGFLMSVAQVSDKVARSKNVGTKEATRRDCVKGTDMGSVQSWETGQGGGSALGCCWG